MHNKCATKRELSDFKHFVVRGCKFQLSETFCRGTKCFEKDTSTKEFFVVLSCYTNR